MSIRHTAGARDKKTALIGDDCFREGSRVLIDDDTVDTTSYRKNYLAFEIRFIIYLVVHLAFPGPAFDV